MGAWQLRPRGPRLDFQAPAGSGGRGPCSFWAPMDLRKKAITCRANENRGCPPPHFERVLVPEDTQPSPSKTEGDIAWVQITTTVLGVVIAKLTEREVGANYVGSHQLGLRPHGGCPAPGCCRALSSQNKQLHSLRSDDTGISSFRGWSPGHSAEMQRVPPFVKGQK